MQIASAGLEVGVSQNGTLQKIKGDKQCTGHKKVGLGHNYKQTEFTLRHGDKIYLYTDGIQDQKGGELGFPLGKKRFFEELTDLSNLEMGKQLERLNEQIQAHQGVRSSQDDKCLFGFQL